MKNTRLAFAFILRNIPRWDVRDAQQRITNGQETEKVLAHFCD